MHLVTVAPSPLLLRDAKTKPRSADDRSPPKPAAGGQPLTPRFWKQRGAAYTYTARDPHELPSSKTEGNCLSGSTTTLQHGRGNRRGSSHRLSFSIALHLSIHGGTTLSSSTSSGQPLIHFPFVSSLSKGRFRAATRLRGEARGQTKERAGKVGSGFGCC